jgi:hypothetical protein
MEMKPPHKSWNPKGVARKAAKCHREGDCLAGSSPQFGKQRALLQTVLEAARSVEYELGG